MPVTLHKTRYINNDLIFISFCLVILFLMAGPAMAEKGGRLFMSDEIITMELRTDFSAILKSRTEDPEFFDGEMVYYDLDGRSVKLSVRVSARGNFRRDPENCAFPPLYVEFMKNEAKNTLFGNHDKLKLVTPCQREKEVIEEYIIYRMYNQVTEQSMKARLAKVRYFDTESGKELFEGHSFFLEDKNHIAKRNNAVIRDRFITTHDLNRDNYKKLAFFQYLIGNLDWYVESRRNIIVMQPSDSSSMPVAVPYDFDLAGFVNPAYSKPKGVPAKQLRDKRVFRGLCYTEEELRDIFTFYENLKLQFESIIKNNELLSGSDKRQLLRYISHFYTVIKKEDLVKLEILAICQTPQYHNVSELSETLR
ncbi:MAG: hypothetical protein K0B05_06940 [Bacteroidales bacterium]|nr:hypothetical protein [Bacteroidales bacterium]